MLTLYFISHTHWDREWHEPFQIFRLRLTQTIDKLLDILARDPDYKYFMLDGQTVVLEDFVEVQPEREAELKAHVKSGRVLVGPWYILPDEFLVSGESIIRNLQRGTRLARAWGKSMPIGYIPDPFGHISQMPQLLAGFGIHAAMFRRGLADEATEVWWEGADGTRALATYLRDGYDNAAWLPRDPHGFVEGLRRLVDSLAPHSVTPNLLMMNGTDHMQPWENLTALLRAAAEQMPDLCLVHSNLPEYEAAVQEALASDGGAELYLAKGELRNPKRHHLLPGVTSTRMWIKQRNARAQNLLEQWAEPLAAVACALQPQACALKPDVHLAWKYLLQNHPHDSICGCSVDQVHEEMAPRFDWVEQIGGDVTRRALDTIASAVDTSYAPPVLEGGAARSQPPTAAGVAIVVLNPAPGPRAEAVTLPVELPVGLEQFQLVDANGGVLPFVELGRHVQDYFHVSATADDLRWMFGTAQSGKVEDYILRAFAFRVEPGQVYLDITVSNQGEPNLEAVQAGLAQLSELAANPEIKTFHVRVHSLPRLDLTFFARDLPGCGYKTFWLVPRPLPLPAAPPPTLEPAEKGASDSGAAILENEFLRVEPDARDGTLTITDKTTGAVFAGANRFVDGGDRGDLYNYCPPEEDLLVEAPVEPPVIELLEKNEVRQILRIRTALEVPAFLTADRRARSSETVRLAVSTFITLYAGARRIDFRAQVENLARDHRLRVEFPTSLVTEQSYAGQAFDIVARDIDLPPAGPDWIEQPRPEKPMQKFVAVNDGRIGLALATRGLPEYEVRRGAATAGGVTVILTLLRCISWLSRPDLPNRRGDAGPEKATPGAQELGTHFFEYSLIPYAAEDPSAPGPVAQREADAIAAGGEAKPLAWREARAEALGFDAPLRALATDLHPAALPAAGSWVEVSDADFILTALKPPEEGTGLIVRGFNAGEAAIRVHLRPFLPFVQARRVTLDEAPAETLGWNDSHAVEIQVRPREIVTMRFDNG